MLTFMFQDLHSSSSLESDLIVQRAIAGLTSQTDYDRLKELLSTERYLPYASGAAPVLETIKVAATRIARSAGDIDQWLTGREPAV